MTPRFLSSFSVRSWNPEGGSGPVCAGVVHSGNLQYCRLLGTSTPASDVVDQAFVEQYQVTAYLRSPTCAQEPPIIEVSVDSST